MLPHGRGSVLAERCGRAAQRRLHLVERFGPVLSGKYLEYKMTAEDPKALAKPYT